MHIGLLKSENWFKVNIFPLPSLTILLHSSNTPLILDSLSGVFTISAFMDFNQSNLS